MWLNKNHLADASNASKSDLGYFKHCLVSLQEAIFCFAIAVGSIVHAMFPWVLDFKLIEWRVNRLKTLKQRFPEDPVLKKVHFDE